MEAIYIKRFLLKRIFYCLFLCLALSSCSSQKITKDEKYNIVKNNIEDFENIIDYVISKNYHDNFKENKPLDYTITKDSVLKSFQEKYNILSFQIYSGQSLTSNIKTAISINFDRRPLKARKVVIFDFSEKGTNYEEVLLNTKQIKDRVFFMKQ